jgi:asparagine synthase (glutamine-hydrolysing)
MRGYPIGCLISIKSKNPYSYMFHTPNVDLVHLQAEAMDIPLIEQKTEGKKEEELIDLKNALEKAKEEYRIEGVVTGAISSSYQRERIERVCDELHLTTFSPLWGLDQEKEIRAVVAIFEIIFSSISAYGLDRSWLGRRISDRDIDRLVSLNELVEINIAGEGGEFESLVLDGPAFKRKMEIKDSFIIEEDENTARLIIKEATLVDKG